MVPAKLQKAEKDLDEFRKKYDSMMQLKPLKENVSHLEIIGRPYVLLLNVIFKNKFKGSFNLLSLLKDIHTNMAKYVCKCEFF